MGMISFLCKHEVISAFLKSRRSGGLEVTTGRSGREIIEQSVEKTAKKTEWKSNNKVPFLNKDGKQKD